MAARQARDDIPVLSDPGTVLAKDVSWGASAGCLAAILAVDFVGYSASRLLGETRR